jgi:hypothetical protein
MSKENPFLPNPDGLYAKIRSAIDRELDEPGTSVFVPLPASTTNNEVHGTFATVRRIARFRHYDMYIVPLLDQQGDPGVRIFRD